jgi:hypothetical protein
VQALLETLHFQSERNRRRLKSVWLERIIKLAALFSTAIWTVGGVVQSIFPKRKRRRHYYSSPKRGRYVRVRREEIVIFRR